MISQFNYWYKAVINALGFASNATSDYYTKQSINAIYGLLFNCAVI